jgi:hypothetical protein
VEAHRPVDAWGVAKALAVIVLIVAVNVALRFVDLPDVDLPDVDLASFDVPDWLRWVNRGKNLVVAALIAVAVISAIVKSRRT